MHQGSIDNDDDLQLAKWIRKGKKWNKFFRTFLKIFHIHIRY